MYGFLLINKPKGVTSYDCIRHLKKLLPRKTKIGHTGTLDPFASGLLIVCIGREATKQVPKLMGLKKTYVVKAKLGELTDTLDGTGQIVETIACTGVTTGDIQQAIDELGSEYLQIPPIYSALKHEGQPLYKLAREGKISAQELVKITEGKQRKVTIYSCVLADCEYPYFSFTATVSSGTYVRSLANDIAGKLGCVATTHELCRTQIGSLSLEQAISLSEVTDMSILQQNLRDNLDI